MMLCKAVPFCWGHYMFLIGVKRTKYEREYPLQLLFNRGLFEMEKIKSQYLSNDKGQNMEVSF